MLKLNLGCGQDIRLGYINVDLAVNDPRVIQNDFRDLSKITNNTGTGIDDSSVEEIICIHGIEFLRADELQAVLNNWKTKMSVGGQLFIQSYDYDHLANSIVYDRVDIIGINRILFGEQPNLPHRGVYSLPNLEAVLRALEMDIIEKGYQGHEFYIRAVKTK